MNLRNKKRMDLFNMQGSGSSKWAWKSLIILVGLSSFLVELHNVCAYCVPGSGYVLHLILTATLQSRH